MQRAIDACGAAALDSCLDRAAAMPLACLARDATLHSARVIEGATLLRDAPDGGSAFARRRVEAHVGDALLALLKIAVRDGIDISDVVPDSAASFAFARATPRRDGQSTGSTATSTPTRGAVSGLGMASTSTLPPPPSAPEGASNPADRDALEETLEGSSTRLDMSGGTEAATATRPPAQAGGDAPPGESPPDLVMPGSAPVSENASLVGNSDNRGDCTSDDSSPYGLIGYRGAAGIRGMAQMSIRDIPTVESTSASPHAFPTPKFGLNTPNAGVGSPLVIEQALVLPGAAASATHQPPRGLSPASQQGKPSPSSTPVARPTDPPGRNCSASPPGSALSTKQPTSILKKDPLTPPGSALAAPLSMTSPKHTSFREEVDMVEAPVVPDDGPDGDVDDEAAVAYGSDTNDAQQRTGGPSMPRGLHHQSPPALRTVSVDGSPASGGVNSRSQSEPTVRSPNSPNEGEGLFGLMGSDYDRVVMSDDEDLSGLGAINVKSIHSTSASPGGSRLMPPHLRRGYGTSPRPASSPALAFGNKAQAGAAGEASSMPNSASLEGGAPFTLDPGTRAWGSREDLAGMLGSPTLGSREDLVGLAHRNSLDDQSSAPGHSVTGRSVFEGSNNTNGGKSGSVNAPTAEAAVEGQGDDASPRLSIAGGDESAAAVSTETKQPVADEPDVDADAAFGSSLRSDAEHPLVAEDSAGGTQILNDTQNSATQLVVSTDDGDRLVLAVSLPDAADAVAAALPQSATGSMGGASAEHESPRRRETTAAHYDNHDDGAQSDRAS